QLENLEIVRHTAPPIIDRARGETLSDNAVAYDMNPRIGPRHHALQMDRPAFRNEVREIGSVISMVCARVPQTALDIVGPSRVNRRNSSTSHPVMLSGTRNPSSCRIVS